MNSAEVELKDCGQASVMTKGLFFGGFYEGAVPPYSYCPNPSGANCNCYPGNGCERPANPTDPLDALRADFAMQEKLKK